MPFEPHRLTQKELLEHVRQHFGDDSISDGQMRQMVDAVCAVSDENLRFMLSLYPRTAHMEDVIERMGIGYVPDRSQLFHNISQPAHGRHLDYAGAIFGIKRSWWGFEPDFLYRRRMKKRVMQK